MNSLLMGWTVSVLFVFGVLISPVDASPPIQISHEETFQKIEADIQDLEYLLDSRHPHLGKINLKLVIISNDFDLLYESVRGSDTYPEKSVDRLQKISQKIEVYKVKAHEIVKQLKGDEGSGEERQLAKKIQKLLLKIYQKNEKLDKALSTKKLIKDAIKKGKLEKDYSEVYNEVSIEELEKEKHIDKRIIPTKVFKKISKAEKWDLLQFFLNKQLKKKDLDSETKLTLEQLSEKTVSSYKSKSKFTKLWEKIQDNNQKKIAKIEKTKAKAIEKNEQGKISEAQLDNILENLEEKKNKVESKSHTLDCQPNCPKFLAFAEPYNDVDPQTELPELVESNPEFVQLEENILNSVQVPNPNEIFEHFGILLGKNGEILDDKDLKKEIQKKIDKYEKTIDKYEKKIDKYEKNIVKDGEKIEEGEQNIEEEEKKSKIDDKKIEKYEKKIDDYKEKIEKDEEKIDKFEKKIEKVVEKIEKYVEKVNKDNEKK